MGEFGHNGYAYDQHPDIRPKELIPPKQTDEQEMDSELDSLSIPVTWIAISKPRRWSNGRRPGSSAAATLDTIDMPLLPTCLVGSYPAARMADRPGETARSRCRGCARRDLVAAIGPRTGWQAAQDDATILAIRDQERAGASTSSATASSGAKATSNHFATALEGVDIRESRPRDEPHGARRSRKPTASPLRCGALPGRRARHRAAARQNTDCQHQGDGAGPLHHEPPGAGRSLRRRSGRWRWTSPLPPMPTIGTGSVRGGRRRWCRSTSRGCSNTPTRRGLRASRRLDRAPDRALAGRWRCICASAMPPWCATSLTGYSFLGRAQSVAPPAQISVEAAQPRLDLRGAAGGCRRRPSSSA